MAAPNSHSKALFVTPDGVPMRFYVRPGPNKRQLAPLITHGGGVVCRIQEPGAFLLADPTEDQLGPGYISTSFITDCVSSNRSFSPRAYRLLPLKTGTGLLRSLPSRFSTVQCGGSEDLKGKPTVQTNNAETTVQGQKKNATTSVTTQDGAIGEREDNMEQMGNLSPEWAQEDDQGHKGSSPVDMANKEEADAQGSRGTCTSIKATTEESTRETEDNGKMKGFTSSRRSHGDKEGHKGRSSVDLTNKEEATTQGNRETCTSMMATTEEATGETEVNGEKKGFTSIKRTHADKEGNKGSSAVDLTNKEEADAQGSSETCTSMVATTEEATEKREGNGQKKRFTSPRRAPGDKENHKGSSAVYLTNKEEADTQENKESYTSTVTTTKETTEEKERNMERMTGASREESSKIPASKSRIPTKPASECRENLKPDVCTASPRDGTCMELATEDKRGKKNTGGAVAAHSTSRTQKKALFVGMIDVEQTLNVDENYSSLIIPDPRTSTPAPGNPNTVKDLEADTTDDNAVMKDGESHLVTQFRRPKRKVASITLFDGRENQHSPNTKQRRAEKITNMQEEPRNETRMSDEKHCGPVEQSHGAESPTGQMEHPKADSPKKCTAKETGRQSIESQQVQAVIPLQGHEAATTLRQGRMAFTKEEDLAILVYIRDNASSSCTVTGNVLWKDMEKKKVLGRTWQAMKARYVKYLVNHKYKYKLPPKCSTFSSKNSSSKRMHKFDKTNDSWLNCASTSSMTPKNCDVIQPQDPADIPQNCDSTQSSVSADIPQNCDITQPNASADIPQICDTTQPSASAYIPQNHDAIKHSVSADIPQNCDTTQPSASANNPKNCDTTLPSASTDIPQNCGPTQPSASVDINQQFNPTKHSATSGTPRKNGTMPPTASAITPQRADTMPPTPTSSAVAPQKCVTMLPSASTDTPQKNDIMPPTASAVTPKKCETMLPSASSDTLQKSDSVLPSTSADTHLSCRVTQYEAFTSANTMETNIASKEQCISTPRKRSSDPTNDNESSTEEKGNKMLPLPHSPKTVRPDRKDSGNSEELHIFEAANLEFEETDDNMSSPEQPAPVVSQTENNNSTSHVDETPPTSQASESEDLQEAMIDMITEFKLDVSLVTQALFFNSGELGSTRHFLRTGSRPDGYPIWEPKDDLDLMKNNPKMQSHLINKYGADNVARRVAFLAS
ncbi:telomeric repeat-binding factor 2-interacting protein 1 [Lithobates pipiens]